MSWSDPSLHTDRRSSFDASASTVWAALGRAPDYQRWWPWLQRFDGVHVADGERWTCTVKPPLPYTVSFVLVLRDVDHQRRSVSADITGEVVGTAAIDIDETGSGCSLRLVAELAPASAFLRSLTRVAGPVARRGHDVVIDRALAQFAAHAL